MIANNKKFLFAILMKMGLNSGFVRDKKQKNT